MSNRLFQGIIHQMKDAIDRVIGVVDETSVVIACSELGRIGEVNENINSETLSATVPFTINGCTYKAFGNGARSEYAIFVSGSDELAQKYVQLLSVSLSSIKQYYDEKYDRSNFIKNVILDNILPGDILIKAKELHLPVDVSRVVFLIQAENSTNFSIFDILQNLFPEKGKNFIVNIDERYLALIKEVRPGTEAKEFEKIAKSITDTLYTEALTKVYVGIGSICNNIRDLALSYKEAQVALEVGKVFDTDKQIISYENLGIGRLIYQLPTTLCELFLSEVFRKESIEALDQETILTIQKFFKHNLNVSETARELFVHRNTLVDRLDKIEKITGLDLRQFDQAVTFKVAMMVQKYLQSNAIKF